VPGDRPPWASPIAPASVLAAQVADARRRMSLTERLVFHVTTEHDGAAVDVRVRELSAVHVYVPDEQHVLDGARGLIAKVLGVDPASFDVAPDSGAQTAARIIRHSR
jgi:hypothetical protein